VSGMYSEFLKKLKDEDCLCLGTETSGSLFGLGAKQLGVVAEQIRRHGSLSGPFGHIALTLFGFHEDSTTTGSF
jgi:hypothetical protein